MGNSTSLDNFKGKPAKGCYTTDINNIVQGDWQNIPNADYYSCDNPNYNEDGYNVTRDSSNNYHPDAQCHSNKKKHPDYIEVETWGINYMLNICDKQDDCKGITTDTVEGNLTNFCMYTENQMNNIYNKPEKESVNLYKKEPKSNPIPNYPHKCSYKTSDIKYKTSDNIYTKKVNAEANAQDQSRVLDFDPTKCLNNQDKPSIKCLTEHKCTGYVETNDGTQRRGFRCGDYGEQLLYDATLKDITPFMCSNNSTLYFNPNPIPGWSPPPNIIDT